jgi:hypothetical protein
MLFHFFCCTSDAMLRSTSSNSNGSIFASSTWHCCCRGLVGVYWPQLFGGYFAADGGVSRCAERIENSEVCTCAEQGRVHRCKCLKARK